VRNGSKLIGMKRRAVRILILLWLGWYLSGPLAEVVDFWDTPPEEMSDIARVAGGVVALVGAGLAITLAQIRKFGQCFRLASQWTLRFIVLSTESTLPSLVPVPWHPPHSPPMALRI
jgi:hypothetical protein